MDESRNSAFASEKTRPKTKPKKTRLKLKKPQ